MNTTRSTGDAGKSDRPKTDDLEHLPANLRRIGYLMDESIRLPGGFRIGWDAVLGLIPGVGDAIASSASIYIVLAAARAGVSKPVLLRMLGNIGLELLVGAVPVVGDLFDGIFKANIRNLKLMNRQVAHAHSDSRGSSLWIVGVVSAAVLIVVVLAALAAATAFWAWQLLMQGRA